MPRKPETEEELYFQRQELARRQRLRAEMEADARRLQREQKKLEHADRIAALGFTGDRAQVFHLIPLVHVAWADGSVTRKERATVLEILRDHGIEPGSDPFQMIESMLEEQPSPEFMAETLAILKELVEGEEGVSITLLCIRIAEASGGLFGLGIGDKVDPRERAQIETIARAFGDPALRAVYRALS